MLCVLVFRDTIKVMNSDLAASLGISGLEAKQY